MNQTTSNRSVTRRLQRFVAAAGAVALVPLTVGGQASAEDARSGVVVVNEGETIQAAIDDAEHGTQIVVLGDHTETVAITKSGITLRGARGASISVPADAPPGPCGFVAAVCVIPARAAGAAFPDFPDPSDYLTDITVRDLTLNSPNGDGVGVLFVDGITIRGNTALDTACNGVYALSSTDAEITRNRVGGSVFCDGIRVILSSDIEVSRNASDDNAFTGITVEESNDAVISRNTTTGNCAGIVAFDRPDDPAGDPSAPGFGATSSNVAIVRNVANANNGICFPFGPGIPIGGSGIIGSAIDGLAIGWNTTNDNVAEGFSITAAGINVQDSLAGTPTNRVIVALNTSFGNASPAGPVDLDITTSGEIIAIEKNRCSVGVPDAIWCTD